MSRYNVYLRRLSRQVFVRWVHDRVPFDRALDFVIRENRCGQSERQQLKELCYSLLRHKTWLLGPQWDPQQQSDLKRFQTVLEKFEQGASLDEAHAQHTPRFEHKPIEHLMQVHGLSKSWIDSHDSDHLQAWNDYLHCSLQEAPVFVRLRAPLADILEKEPGLGLQISQRVPGVAWVDHGSNKSDSQKGLWLESSQAYKKGLFEIQDEHSQLVAQVIQSHLHRQGQAIHQPMHQPKILDLCAGAGGKTLHLADLMPNTQIDAYDVVPAKLKNLQTRAQRLGLSCNRSDSKIRTLQQLPTSNLLSSQYDAVLVDAPCSGSGTLRRHPWFLYDKIDVQNLQDIQFFLLNKAFGLLKPGGLLLYVTCSVLAKENHQTLERWVEDKLKNNQHKDFEFLKQSLFDSLPEGIRVGLNQGPSQRLNPGEWGVCIGLDLDLGRPSGDAFFLALLQKNQ